MCGGLVRLTLMCVDSFFLRILIVLIVGGYQKVEESVPGGATGMILSLRERCGVVLFIHVFYLIIISSCTSSGHVLVILIRGTLLLLHMISLKKCEDELATCKVSWHLISCISFHLAICTRIVVIILICLFECCFMIRFCCLSLL